MTLCLYHLQKLPLRCDRVPTAEGTVPGQRHTGRAQQFGQFLIFLQAADTPLAWHVEPDIAEVQPGSSVRQQTAGTADVIVVDVGDDEQIDMTATRSVRRDRGQSGPKRRVGLVRPGVHQHAPGALAHGAFDEQAVAMCGWQDLRRMAVLGIVRRYRRAVLVDIPINARCARLR